MKKLFYAVAMAVIMASCSRPYVIVQIADAQLGFTASDKCRAEGREYDENVSYELTYLKAAVEMVNEIRPDAVVFTGDQVHHAGNQVEWSAFRRAVSGISKDVKVFHLPGNHDIFVGYNGLNMQPFEERFGKTCFLHEDGNVRLIGLNTNLIKYDDPGENSQFEWLVASLQKSRKGQATLIFGHHPFFLEDIDEEDGYFQISKDKRKIYFDLFSKNDVDAVFTGHLHDNAAGEYKGIPSMTMTSVSRQLGGAQPSIRVITVSDGNVSSEIRPLE